jgi:hypothetical protein
MFVDIEDKKLPSQNISYFSVFLMKIQQKTETMITRLPLGHCGFIYNVHA